MYSAYKSSTMLPINYGQESMINVWKGRYNWLVNIIGFQVDFVSPLPSDKNLTIFNVNTGIFNLILICGK